MVGRNFAHADEDLPDEAGILKAGIDGAGFPKCLRCPDPQCSDAARAAKAPGHLTPFRRGHRRRESCVNLCP